MEGNLPERKDVREEDTWDLSAMYESKEDWEADLREAAALSEEIAGYEGRVAKSKESLAAALSLWARQEQKLDLAYSYAQRLYDQDTRDAGHFSMTQKVLSLATECEGKRAFLVPEILSASEERVREWLNEGGELSAYRVKIEEIWRKKAHSLSAAEERLLAMSGEMAQTPHEVYGILENADFSFPEIEGEGGEMTRITNGSFISLEESPDRRVRRDAFKAYYGVFGQFRHALAALYNGQVRQQMFYARARGYGSTLEASLDASNVPVRVYHSLIETVNKNLDKLHRYVSLRKKCLGVGELHMYDIYVPMVEGAARKIPYEEAKETVLSALAPLGEDYVRRVREGFEGRWIDVYENAGKRSGAYSAGAYGAHPYVLLNYSGTLDSMFTLAHEMGHAMHSCYSNEAQPYIYSGYKIFVAEVASTCNEVLLTEYLLGRATDKRERAYILNHFLDGFKGTLFRQTMFAEFEMETNAAAEAGEGLTADGLSELYLSLNKKYYGPDMESDPEIALEWARIPHFYYDFYVYQYATGFSAAVALARGILREGVPAVERYKKFLSGGCSLPPCELLRAAGVDMEGPCAVQEALDAFGEALGEMEGLCQ